MFIWVELVQLGGLAQLGEMIFIPCSHGTFCLTSIKKFVMSLEKDHIIFKRDFFYFQGDSLQKGITYKRLFTWEKLSHLGGEIIPTRSRHNANFHQQKISVHMIWKFAHLTKISPTADRDLRQVGKYFLIWTHFPGWVRYFFPMKHVQKSIT